MLYWCCIATGVLALTCRCLLNSLDCLPGDARTLVGFLTYDSSLHFYNLSVSLKYTFVCSLLWETMYNDYIYMYIHVIQCIIRIYMYFHLFSSVFTGCKFPATDDGCLWCRWWVYPQLNINRDFFLSSLHFCKYDYVTMSARSIYNLIFEKVFKLIHFINGSSRTCCLHKHT